MYTHIMFSNLAINQKHYSLWFIQYYRLVSKLPTFSFVANELLINTCQLVTNRLTVNYHVLYQCSSVGAEVKYQHLAKCAINS